MEQQIHQEDHPSNSIHMQNQKEPKSQEESKVYEAEFTSQQAIFLTKFLPSGYSFQLSSQPQNKILLQSKNSQANKASNNSKKNDKKNSEGSSSKPNSVRQKKSDSKSQQLQNAVYQKYITQKEISRRNSYEGISEDLKPCIKILSLLKNSKTSWPFREPVDPVALGIPNYTQIVKEPMDLSTIENNLRSQQYVTPTQFHADVNKIIKNSYNFNLQNLEFTKITAEFEQFYKKVILEPNDYQRQYAFPSEQVYRQQSMGSKISANEQRKKKKPETKDFHANPQSSMITLNEKKQLITNIKKLPKEYMKGIVDIVNEGKVKIVGEFDLKDLEPHIIRKLQDFVNQKLAIEAEKNKSWKRNEESDPQKESSFEIEDQDDS